LIKIKPAPQWELPPADLLDAVCVDVFEKKDVKSTYNGKERVRDVITFVFQTADVDSEGARYKVYLDLTNSSHEKAVLPKVLSSWRGKTLSSEEMETLDVESFVGKTARILIVHNTKGDRTYANISNVLPGKIDLKPLDYIRRVDTSKGDDPHGSEVPF